MAKKQRVGSRKESRTESERSKERLEFNKTRSGKDDAEIAK